MTFKSATQPFCRYCGDPIRKYTDMVIVDQLDVGVWPTNAASPTGHIKPNDWPLRSVADCQRHTNLKVVSASYHTPIDENLKPEPAKRYVVHFNVWDGESYTDQFFCTNSCAILMAHSVCKGHGFATKAWRDATAKAKETKT